MGKNKGKGGKGRKKGKNKNVEDQTRPLIFKDDQQVYGQIVKALGGGRFQVKCFHDDKEDTEIICTIRGQMRKREWISRDDVVLVSLRDFQKDKGDIIMKYLPYEVRKLKTYEELNTSIHQDVNENLDDSIIFNSDSSDSDLVSDSEEEIDIDNI